jgi:hypothetical protein
VQLTDPDEYFNHQTSFPHMMVDNSDPNWRERYWYSFQDVKNQNLIVSGGYGKYPNRDVMEGCVMVQCHDRQWNLRASRQLLPLTNRIAVGPLSAEIIEPFRKLRFRLDDNPSGVTMDVEWRSDWPAMLEGKHFEVNRARVTHDIMRYVQLGRVQGSVTVEGERFDLDWETGWGERDHSWGIRPMASVPGDPPVASAAWNFLAFCPMQFESFALHFYLFEAQAGRPTHLSASIIRKDGLQDDDDIVSVDHDFEWEPATTVRTLKGGRITIAFWSGRVLRIDLRALKPRAYLQGGGYGVDQGNWKGEFHLEHDIWDLSQTQNLKNYIKGTSDHLFEARCDGEIGYGIMEYLVRSGYEKYKRKSRET